MSSPYSSSKEILNYYEILEIAPNATQNDIRQAYFRAKAAYGKDSNAVYSLFDASESKAMLERIEEAYIVLSNTEKRKEYDKTHGFIKQLDSLQTSKPTQQKNTYNFGEKKSKPTGNAAEQAAEVIFGNNTNSDPMFNEKDDAAALASARLRNASVTQDYAVPRTLADATATNTSTSMPSEDFTFASRAVRIGTVRRMDLSKPYNKNDSMEQAIAEEKAFRGEFLKKVREYKGVNIDELSDFTKISKAYLNCIEAEEFHSLPAAAYIRGFIIQIAKALKLSHDSVANGYMNHYKEIMQERK